MAVKIGITSGAKNAAQITLTQDGDETAAFSEEYGVANYADNMKIAIDGNDTIYTVTDNSSGTLSIDPVLSDNVGTNTDVFKIYEGAHGTTAEHLRKRLLGYI